MLNTLRSICEDESGATGFENGLLIVLAVVSTVTILGTVEGSIRDIFQNSAIQADTDRQINRR